MNKQPAVYILASKRNGTLYVGVTSDLVRTTREHGVCYSAGEEVEGMETSLVAGINRKYKSELARFVSQNCLTGFRLEFIPMKIGAGMTRKDNRRLVKLALVPYLTLTLFPDFAEAASCRHAQGEKKDNF